MTALFEAMPLLGAVFVASITGSIHCAGMCGPLAVVACGSSTCGSSKGSAWSYQCARGGSYAVVGAIAGSLGSLTDFSGGLVGAQHVASILAGVTLTTVGLFMLLRLGGAKLGAPQLPHFFASIAREWHLRALRLPPRFRAAAIGAATPLLPCGWLWAFAVVAAGTASVGTGALVRLV
ncbi:MAG: sulfite exporter TauE/SafE family protein, partial [Planctomycetota bacterium]